MSMQSIVVPVLAEVVLINLILSGIFLRRPSDVPKFLFGLITACTALWGAAIIGFYTPAYRSLVDWVVLTHVAALLIALLTFLFSYHFPRRLFSNERVAALPVAAVIGLIYVIVRTDLVVGQTIGLTYVLGPWYPVYGAVVTALFLGAFVFLGRQVRVDTDDNERRQVWVILLGAVATSSLALFTDLLLPYFGMFSLTWLGPVGTLVLIVSMLVVILRLRLFSLKVAVSWLAGPFIATTLFSELFFARSVPEFTFKAVQFIAIAIFSYLFARAVYAEVQSREEAEALAAQRDTLLHFVSHEVKGLLTKAEGGFAAIVEGDYGEAPPKMQTMAGQAVVEMRRGVAMVSELLKSGSYKHGAVSYAMEPFDLRAVAAQLVEEKRLAAEAKGLALTFTADAGTDYMVLGDAGQIGPHVIGNLIDNAISYTPKGSIRVSVARGNGGGPVGFAVSDTGIGITEEDKARLFTEGGRGKDALTVNAHSTGYGLFIAKAIIEAHRGSIRAESAGPGKGSTFSFDLPAVSRRPS